MVNRSQDFETLAVQSGVRARSDFRSTAPGIFPSTTFTYDNAARTHAALDPLNAGFAYARNANPSARTLEAAIAALEGTEEAVVFSSGMAALHGALLASGVRPGHTILAASDLYGVTRTLLAGLFAELGFVLRTVDVCDLASAQVAFEQTHAPVLCFETVSNPLLRVPDTRALIDIAHSHGAMALVDNSFVSPYLFQPSKLGADLVVESATKYMGGHGDVIAGVLACDRDLALVARSVRTATGGILGAFEAWLVLRGTRTLALRVRKHCENAAVFADWLSTRPEVTAVHYPGQVSNPWRALVETQFRDGLGGGMVAFDTDFNTPQVETFMDALILAVPGTSLGDVETLVLYPALSSHRTLTSSERVAAGIGDGLLRVSVGLENVNDIIADFEQAFAAVAK